MNIKLNSTTYNIGVNTFPGAKSNFHKRFRLIAPSNIFIMGPFQIDHSWKVEHFFFSFQPKVHNNTTSHFNDSFRAKMVGSDVNMSSFIIGAQKKRKSVGKRMHS